MKALALFLAMASAVDAGDFQWITPLHQSAPAPLARVDIAEPPVPKSPVQNPIAPPILDLEIQSPRLDLSRFVYAVQVRNGTNISQAGSAVSIGNGRLVSASHIIEGMNNAIVEVLIDGQWRRATYATVRGVDVMNLRVANKGLPGVARRDPEYMEPVVVCGMKSGLQNGIYVNHDTVALDVELSGVDNGDSGGGVFGLDGKLLGTIRGINPDNPRVVMFTETAVSLRGIPGARPDPIVGPSFAGSNFAAVSPRTTNGVSITVNGRNESVNEILKWYRGGGYWTHPTEITHHLSTEHGIPLSQLQALSSTTKEKLHSALHERDSGRAAVQSPRQVAPRYTAPSASCPSGNCPLQRSNGYYQPRQQRQGFLSRVFGK